MRGTAPKLDWTTERGSRRYVARLSPSRRVEIVRQNTAAGADRWAATYIDAFGNRRRIARGDYLTDVKRDAEAWVAGR